MPRNLAEGLQFKHPAGIETISTDSLLVALTTELGEPWVHIDLPKKTVYDSSHLSTLIRVLRAGFVVLACSSWLSRPDTIYQNSLPLYQNSLPITYYCIGHRLELYFFHFPLNFYSAIIEQLILLIDLRKVKTERLKFRTDLQDQIMDGWSVTG